MTIVNNGNRLVDMSQDLRNIEIQMAVLKDRYDGMRTRLQEECPHPKHVVSIEERQVRVDGKDEELKEVFTCGFCQKMWVNNNDKENNNDGNEDS